jgi:hypothetical protein
MALICAQPAEVRQRMRYEGSVQDGFMAARAS